MNSNYAPICLFTYNRLQETKETINALQNNFLAKDSDLFIFSDGPKNKSDINKVEEVRSYLHTISNFKSVVITQSIENIGLAQSIVSGITKTLIEYDKIIILEDDIKTSKGFLKFMNDALNYYEKNEEVMQVSGFMFPINNNELPDTFFYQANSCWGWGTWKNSWDLLIDDCDLILKKLNEKNVNWSEFNSLQGNEFKKQLLKNKSGKMNTWAVKWHSTIKIYGGKVLHPKSSFVSNIGFSGNGENCKKGDFIGEINDSLLLDVSHAEKKSNHFALIRLKEYFRIRYSLIEKIKRKLKSFK